MQFNSGIPGYGSQLQLETVNSILHGSADKLGLKYVVPDIDGKASDGVHYTSTGQQNLFALASDTLNGSTTTANSNIAQNRVNNTEQENARERNYTTGPAAQNSSQAQLPQENLLGMLIQLLLGLGVKLNNPQPNNQNNLNPDAAKELLANSGIHNIEEKDQLGQIAIHANAQLARDIS